MRVAAGVLLILVELVALTVALFAPDNAVRLVSVCVAVGTALALEKWMRPARSR